MMQRSSTNRFRPFVQIGQGMLPGSLSGSETDVSTSNENLSTATEDERYYAMMIIGHQQRQEPQGQEGGNVNDTADQSTTTRRDGSNRSSLDVSSSSYNTLIIHSAGEEPWTGRGSGPRDSSNQHQHQHSSTDAPHERLEITDIPDDYLSQSSVLKHLAKEVKVTDEEDAPQQRSTPASSSRKRSPTVRARALGGGGGGDKLEKVNISKSHPDLSTIGIGKCETGFRRGVSAPRPPTRGREEEGLGVGGSGGRGRREDEVWPTAEMVEILIKENSALKHELENCYRRVERTQRLEQEILKVHRGHEELVQSCERRERLERAARARLQSDCRRLQELNRVLREQCEALVSAQAQADNQGTGSGGTDTGPLRRELGKREGLIKQLIVHNKELSAAKERQEIELAAQRATLQEQRTHIDILDTALTNAQGNVVRLEDECRKKQVYVERVAQLQRALSSLQLASDRREQTERKLRSQLEHELQLRAGGGGRGGVDSGGSDESASELKRLLREKEERIMMLEGECSKWEQRFLEESALRQAAIDAASIPKDAKIAALEKTSQETERIIAEARNEKIRHMDEVHAAQRKVADLESRVKDLESKLAEKDAMIRVLQKHTYDKDVSSMLTRSPHHTPHPSLSGTTGTTDIDHVLATREELVSSVLTNSTTYGCSSSSGDSTSYRSRSCVPGATVLPSYGGTSDYSEAKQSLDDQLKEIDNRLDTQLLSKRGLCCFPGFANQVAAQREGDTPGTLLARLRRDANGKGTPFSRNESAMLEKQGRASQRQRAAAPPPVRASAAAAAPSSLPRPPARRSGLPTRKRDSPARSLIPGPASAAAAPASASASPRRFGEYGRLSESAGSSAASLIRRPASGRRDGERDSASTLSDGSASSLPAPSKIRLYGSTRRGASLGRDSKSSTDSTTSKYRIQF